MHKTVEKSPSVNPSLLFLLQIGCLGNTRVADKIFMTPVFHFRYVENLGCLGLKRFRTDSLGLVLNRRPVSARRFRTAF